MTPGYSLLRGRGPARGVGSGKGCWRGATAANEVKLTLASLSGWGRGVGLGVHAGWEHKAGRPPAGLSRQPCYSYSKSQAMASGSEERGATAFPLSSLRGSGLGACSPSRDKSKISADSLRVYYLGMFRPQWHLEIAF